MIIVIGAALLMPLLPAFWTAKLLFLAVGSAFALVKISVYALIGLLTDNQQQHASLLNLTEGFFMLGVLAGLWAQKFDQLAAVQNFVVMPMTFLSGTFYLVDKLPEPFRSASHFNPFFYLIDGFRYGFIGHSDGNLLAGVVMVAVLNVALFLWCWRMFNRGV